MNIEKFAAFLDGNLSKEDMLQIKQCISADSEWNELYDMTQDIDKAIEDNNKYGFEVPQEILDMDISIPQISDEVDSSVATLNFDSLLENVQYSETMCACVDPMSTHFKSGEDMDDDIVLPYDVTCSMDNDLNEDSNFINE